MSKHAPKPILTTATPWTDVLLVCRKCSKKLKGGFGPDGDDSLASAVKRELRGNGKRRSTRVIEVKCFGLCPKAAVTVLRGSAPGALLAIPAGADLGGLVTPPLPPPA